VLLDPGVLTCSRSIMYTAPIARAATLPLLTSLLLAACSPAPDQLAGLELAYVQRCGMNYSHTHDDGRGYGGPGAAHVIDDLSTGGVRVFGAGVPLWMESSTDVVVRERPGVELGALRSRLAADAAAIAARGGTLLLKPHLELADGSWRGAIAPARERGGWPAWFASYRARMVEIARLGEAVGANSLCVGLELRSATAAEPQRWVALIAELRGIFSGRLLYCANWDEAAQVSFWSELDAVGVQMFAPLAGGEQPSLAALRAGARGWLSHFDGLARAARRPLWLTEVGYVNRLGTAGKPWLWPEDLGMVERSDAGDAAQAAAYRAILETFGRAPRVEAMLWWRWLIDGENQPAVGFSPRGRPAEQLLAEHCRPQPDPHTE
jgi:hypothetical protein